jgi:AmpD protein
MPKTAAPATPDAGDPLWQAGWYRFAHRIASPNFGPRPPGVYGGDEVQRLFTNTLDWDAHPYFGQIRGMQVSAHFFIRRDGALLQFVSCDARAWHAGNSQYRGRADCNDDSVGIELEGLEGEAFEPAQYEALAAVCAALAQHYPIRHVAGHEHIAPARKQDPGPGFDWALLQRELGWPREWFPA